MSNRGDEEIEVHLPFFHIRVGGRGWRAMYGRRAQEEVIEMESDDAGTYQAVRREVRRRLRFFRHAFTFVALNAVFFLIDWSTGGSYWVQWVALIWGIFLGAEFISTFVGPYLWGAEAEERLVQRELRRRRGS